MVAAYGALVGRGLRGRGDGESSLARGCSSRCACRASLPLMARALRLGRRGVLPSQWLQLSVCLKGTAAPTGTSSHARGTGSPAQPVVAAHGAPEGGWLPLRRGLTGRGGGESTLARGCSSRCAFGACLPLMARAHSLGGTGSPAQLMDAALGAPVGDGYPQWRAHRRGGRGV